MVGLVLFPNPNGEEYFAVFHDKITLTASKNPDCVSYKWTRWNDQGIETHGGPFEYCYKQWTHPIRVGDGE